MNKKKLPKAVLRTAEQMRDADTSAAPAAKQRSAAPALPDNVIEMMPKAEAPAASPVSDAAQRRRKAVAIVERYANLSAVGGAIPVPLVNAAAIMALMIRMVKTLSELYEVPFERTRTRATMIALMGGALPTGFSTIATSSLTFLVPGLNLIGLAVASVTSGAFARAIGQLYIEHFENGVTIDLRSLIKR
jgi:uncharacterized protein (DUF697 family)